MCTGAEDKGRHLRLEMSAVQGGERERGSGKGGGEGGEKEKEGGREEGRREREGGERGSV